VTRHLVVNGDDFGLTPGINAGILEAHARGILTSASLFAHAPATDDAIRIARITPSLGVGCHLTLVDGRPIAAPARVATLAPDGRFPPTWRAFIARALARRIALHEVEHELTGQIDRIRSAGVPVTHLDAHKHAHAFPPIFEVVVRVAKRFGIGVVRVPCEPDAFGLVRRHWRSAARRQAVENLALAPWAAMDRRILMRERLPAAPVFLGRVLTGLLTRDALVASLASAPAGTIELMTHPGWCDAALDAVPTRLKRQREDEVSLLTDPAVLDRVARERLVLVHHGGSAAFPERHSHVS
jgi:predicted glycoside hydrolase/deacetylase ChbG (UPF0249 family)